MLRSVRFIMLLLISVVLGPLLAAEPAEVAALRAKAEKGNGLAQYNLGLAYAEGELVPADLPEAFVWLSLAAENGSTGKALDTVLGNITDAQLTEGRRRLAEYRTELAAHASNATLGRNPARKPTTRGFSLTAPTTKTAPAPSNEAPVTKPPAASAAINEPTRPDEPATDDLTKLRVENAQLKMDLARAQEQIREQSVALAKLEQELARRPHPTAAVRADSPRSTSPDGNPSLPSRP